MKGGYLVLEFYSRPMLLDRPWAPGAVLYRHLIRESRVQDMAELPWGCRCGLMHSRLVLLKDGTRICCDRFFRIYDPESAAPYDKWIAAY
jgi:hypothetical protein